MKAISESETMPASGALPSSDGREPAVRLEREGRIGWILLNRPGQINAINDEIRQEVPRALAELDADPAIGVIVIRGEGARSFCAGADVKERRGEETAL